MVNITMDLWHAFLEEFIVHLEIDRSCAPATVTQYAGVIRHLLEFLAALENAPRPSPAELRSRHIRAYLKQSWIPAHTEHDRHQDRYHPRLASLPARTSRF